MTRPRAGVRPPAASRRRVAVIIACALAASGCVDTGPSDEDDDVAVEQDAPAPVTTLVLTPFCEGIAALRAELADNAVSDEPVVESTLILATYEQLLPVAPEAIADDLAAVIAGTDGQQEQLDVPEAGGDGDGPAATADAEPNEGFSPAATPAGRVASYIETECVAVSSNPGPSATPPP